MALLVATTIVAALIRLPTLFWSGLWRDEANVYVELTAPTFLDFFHRVAAIDYHPPLYFLIVYPWAAVFGQSELSLKLLPYVLSVLTVPAVYRLGKVVASPAAGVIAAGLFALSPLSIAHSTSYLYPLATLSFTILVTQVAIARRSPPSSPGLLALFLAAAFAINAHYTALILTPLLVVWALFSPGGVKHGALVALTVLAGCASFLPWLHVFEHQQHVGLPYEALADASGKIRFVSIGLTALLPVPDALGAPLVFGGVVISAILLTFGKNARSDGFAVGAIFLAAFFFVDATGLTVARYVLPLAPLLYVFFGSAFAALALRANAEDPAGWRRAGIPALLLLGAALVVLDTTYGVRGAEVPYSGMSAFLADQPPDSSTLYVIAPDYAAPEFAFYVRRRPISYIGFARVRHPEVYTLDDYETLWNDPGAIDKVLKVVSAQANRYSYLELVTDEFARNQYHIPFGKTWDLLASLQKRYRLVSHRRYPGQWAPVSVYRFALPPKGA